MNDLPVELALQVLQELSPASFSHLEPISLHDQPSLHALCAVSHFWNDLVTPILYRVVDLQARADWSGRHGRSRSSCFSSTLSDRSSLRLVVKQLIINLPWARRGSDEPDAALKILMACTEVTDLRVPFNLHFSLGNPSWLRTSMSNVRHLTLGYASGFLDPEETEALLRCCTNIESLQFLSELPTLPLPSLPSLRMAGITWKVTGINDLPAPERLYAGTSFDAVERLAVFDKSDCADLESCLLSFTGNPTTLREFAYRNRDAPFAVGSTGDRDVLRDYAALTHATSTHWLPDQIDALPKGLKSLGIDLNFVPLGLAQFLSGRQGTLECLRLVTDNLRGQGLPPSLLLDEEKGRVRLRSLCAQLGIDVIEQTWDDLVSEMRFRSYK